MIMQFYSYRLKQPSQNLNSNSEKLSQEQQNQKQLSQQSDDVDDDDQYVAIVGNQGFWVEENKFLVAEVKDGMIDPRDAQEVDVFNLPPNQLAYMFRILDKINGE